MIFHIHFFDYFHLPDSKGVDGLRSVVSVDKIARRLSSSEVDRSIRPQDIFEAFDKWRELDHPQEYFHELGTMDGTKKKYRWGLRLWNYQGGHPENSGFPNEMGVIMLTRTWGKGYKDYSCKRETFHLGVVA